MTTVAGVLLLTTPGRAPAVASRLAALRQAQGERTLAGLTLAGGDGDAKVAAVWEGPDGAALERLADRLLAEDPEVLGVFPTFVGEDDGDG